MYPFEVHIRPQPISSAGVSLWLKHELHYIGLLFAPDSEADSYKNLTVRTRGGAREGIG